MGIRTISECDKCGATSDKSDFISEYQHLGPYVLEEPHVNIEITYCPPCFALLCRELKLFLHLFNKGEVIRYVKG
jgi:hypothetical protein